MTSPKQISTNHGFYGTPFQSSECETILRNIVMLQKGVNPDQFTPFSWEDYQVFCTHSVSDTEKAILDSFVDGGYINYRITNHGGGNWLKFEDGKYGFTDKLIGYLITEFPNSEEQ